MRRLLRFTLLLLLLAPQIALALAQIPLTFTFGGSGGTISLMAAGRLSADRVWFVANAAAITDLPYSETPCPAFEGAQQVTCAIWGVIDVSAGTLLSLHGQRDFAASRAALVGDKLLIAGRPNTPNLPQSNESALPAPSTLAGYVVLASPMGEVEFSSYLPQQFFVFDIITVAGELILAGSAPCPECAVFVLDRGVRLLRLNAQLSALRYDRIVPGRWSATGHVIDSASTIHFAASGSDLPTSPQSPIADPPIPPVVDFERQWGGLVGVNPANGSLLYATYLKMGPPAGIVWDARRAGIWVLGETRFADFPVTADAVDTTFCKEGACAMPLCVITTGTRCSYPSEAGLLRVDANGQRIAYATFLGGPLSEKTRALYLLPDGRLNVLMFAEPVGSLPSGNEFGLRMLTEINPDTRVARPAPRSADARWTFNTYTVAHAPAVEFLYARRNTSSPSAAQPPVVHLTPVCDGANSFSRQCFSLVVLAGFGGGSIDEVQQIPGPRGVALIGLAAFMALIALMFRRNRRTP